MVDARPLTNLIAGLVEGTPNETVLGIHDGCLGIVASLLLDTTRSHIAVADDVGSLRQCRHHTFGLVVLLQQFDGQPAGAVAQPQQVVTFQVALDAADAVLDFVAVVDVNVTVVEIVALAAFKNMYHLLQQALQSPTRLERGGNHRHTHQRAQRVDVETVATALQFIVHVQGTHHPQVHIHELGGEIEVALNVGGVDDVDDDVRGIVQQLLADIQFLRGIG